MKLATYQDGSRDGQLVVVARDLGLAHYATGIASCLQQVLDDWDFLAPQLQALYVQLNTGKAAHPFPFDPRQCLAPLPRAYHWTQASAYLAATERQCQLQQQALPADAASVPRLRAGYGDAFLGPAQPLVLPADAQGVDVQTGLAVITGDIPRSSSPARALAAVRLLMLTGTVVRVPSGRAGAAAAAESGGLAIACSPVSVTPDELGPAWQEGRVHLTLQVLCNGRKMGLCDTGPSMHFHFGQLLAQGCKHHAWQAGAVLGSGLVSHASGPNAQGEPEWPQGACSIADKRAIETLQHGRARTPFLRAHDSLCAEMKARDGHSLFGTLALSLLAPEDTAETAQAA
ncbi:MAG: fumarylacetoacetate hydrolase family protein [Giesbergeria sp.]|uniref:fumarylacetoacetate hydrolase family protein n=1 Tax=Giesbergeria sp. TaxID=2818473 RepID=UPI002607AC11|nr:fumarylacetoacetate hydrolase family protein [Giesbergeria sp.]MDD2610840.1 fumarylacetoacetate hydrolase family protein [Giesbergeria sp.]